MTLSRRAVFRSGGATQTVFEPRLRALVHRQRPERVKPMTAELATAYRCRHTQIGERALFAMIAGHGEGCIITSNAAGYTSRGSDAKSPSEESLAHARLIPDDGKPIDLYILADGAGGAASGEVAAETATLFPAAYPMRYYRGGPIEELPPLVMRGIADGHAAILEARRQLSPSKQRAALYTTLAILAIQDRRGYYWSIGDSHALGVLLDDRPDGAHALSRALFLSAPQTLAADPDGTEWDWLNSCGHGQQLGQTLRHALGQTNFDPDSIQAQSFTIPDDRDAIVGLACDGVMLDNNGLGNLQPERFGRNSSALLADNINPLLATMRKNGTVSPRTSDGRRVPRREVKVDHTSLLLHQVPRVRD
ncbi:MAG: hypothetical protein HY696_09760 [Deltaproteobacteria bacterium]|nr:hypothetical protein [Deltaproteobacteria bacterium]